MNSRNGKVYIVGAGPGDPGLITVKGLEKLKQADVIVYDRLVNDDLLAYCREDCEKIFVGKESGYHSLEQEQITEILIRKSELGLVVVRLKGGNPFIFGRGSEEAIALRNAGIDFEIIPGITSGLSAPIYSGIPITHRGLITQCVLITAHESASKPGTQVEWDKLARLKNSTLIIYMGASRIENICNKLIKHGADPSTPAAVIENGTLPKQRTITGRLDRIAQEFKAKNFHAPAIIMIGPTVAMRDEISWYEKKPLFGKRIAMVGNRKQLEKLREMVYDLGGEVLPLPFSESGTLPNCLAGTSHNGEEGFFDQKDPFPLGVQYIEPDGRDFSIMPAGRVSDATSPASAVDIVEDIRAKGADIFVFAGSPAVEHFFDILGDETATKALEHGTPVAINHTAANALIDRDIHNVGIPADNTNEAICDLLLNLLPKSQG